MNARQAVIDDFLADRSPRHREAVIAAHLYLCKRGAWKFRRSESDPADLEQVAAIGLVKATDAYRFERRTPFEAYAWLVIVGELMHYVRDSERAIRIPRALRSLDRRYVCVWEKLAARLHAEPSAAQLAAALDVGIDCIEEIHALRRSQAVDGDLDPFDLLPAPVLGLSLDERLTVHLALEALDERERTIVLGTYGSGLSQSEIARKLRLSQSQVSKLHARALGKLSAKVA